jgi:crossover junction endodeoxyribonuclease RuvC
VDQSIPLPKVLGIDPSTHTGWSLQDAGNEFWHDTGEIKYPGKDAGFKRSMWLASQVEAMLVSSTPALVVFEGYAFGAQHNNYLQVEIGTLFRERVYTRGVPYIIVTPGSLKKFATGSGAAKKEQVMMQVYKRWEFEAKTNNESDAFVLAKLGVHYLTPANDATLTKPQLEVIHTLRKTWQPTKVW